MEEKLGFSSNFDGFIKEIDLCKVFLHKIDRFHLERLSVKVRKAPGLRREPEGQLVGIEGLIFPVIALVELSVFPVAQQRPAGGSHLRADLMGTAGDQLAFDKAQTVSGLQGIIERDAGLGAFLRRFRNVDAVLLCILEQLSFELSGRRTRRTVYDAEIALVDLPVLDLLVEDTQRLGGFCRDDDAAGVAVDTVAERGRECMLLARAPLALGIEIGLNVIDERLAVFRAVVRMDGLPGLFVDEQNIFILIYNMEIRRADSQIGIFFFRGIKKLVVDV